MTKQQRLIDSLTAAFSPSHLQVANESHMHNVPPGSESHFKVQMVSEKFSGKRPVQQHQMVYAALGSLMQEIHALALHTWAPEQWAGEQAAASPQCLGGSK
ncbi:BolA family protein [Simiduia agarivorans]|uniref:Stress-induced morphogen n=1 Tax=Simiduia agarivorans (strain DSM 21679 / JCM 13881 / BCRC 17597 / SA1) TaxID=1117647 RepID=K4KI11_SIMAS|nr:BolA family protein [Simiduia agarivorans]AFU97608.1 stress-induced morphogen [Simiduia agarivorans SA1 = DSM 21679]